MSEQPQDEPQTADDVEPATTKPRRTRAALTARTEAMARFVHDERKREPTQQYGVLVAAVRARFGCSVATAERAIAAGTEMLRVEFERWCGDAPRAIFDAYMNLHNEHVSRAMSSSRERDRVMHLMNARRSLDSVRDMFGMRSAINININNAAALPMDAFAPLSDVQLEALAELDIVADNNRQRILDVPSVEASIEMAGVALDVIEHDDDAEDGER